jgi:hypothetical protein
LFFPREEAGQEDLRGVEELLGDLSAIGFFGIVGFQNISISFARMSSDLTPATNY